jgi:methionyl aminopeptidase
MKWPNNHSTSLGFVKIQDESDFDNYRYSGKITSECLSMLGRMVANKTTKSLVELDAAAEEFFLSKNTIPVFKGYHGFPASVCISVNHQLVHGIPSDYVLQEGDIVTFDTGCNYRRSITDSALTCIFGEPKNTASKELVDATQESLYSGIKAISINGRVGAVGNAIFRYAKGKGYKVIETYTGHGISLDQVHSDPIVLNKSEPNTGPRFRPGMVIAIEPLLVFGNSSANTRTADDKWTVLSDGLSAHFEHSILILNDSVEILTWRDDEHKISNRIFFNKKE